MMDSAAGRCSLPAMTASDERYEALVASVVSIRYDTIRVYHVSNPVLVRTAREGLPAAQ